MSHDRLADRELSDRQVGRSTDDVSILGEHVKAPMLGVLQPGLDHVEVAKEHVHGHLGDREPGTSIDDRPPLSQPRDVTFMA